MIVFCVWASVILFSVFPHRTPHRFSSFFYWFSIDLNVSNCYATETFDSFQFSFECLNVMHMYVTLPACGEMIRSDPIRFILYIRTSFFFFWILTFSIYKLNNEVFIIFVLRLIRKNVWNFVGTPVKITRQIIPFFLSRSEFVCTTNERMNLLPLGVCEYLFHSFSRNMQLAFVKCNHSLLITRASVQC